MNSQFEFTSEGLRFVARPILPTDRELLQNGFSQLSDRAKFLRFSSIDTQLSDSQLNYLTKVDGINHIAWGIADITKEGYIPVGVGRIVKLKEAKDTAEVGITIIDSYQNKGLGKILFILLNIVAGQKGIQQLRYHILSENRLVLNYLNHFDILDQSHDGPLTLVHTRVIGSHKEIANQPDKQEFIEAMKAMETALGL